MKNITILLSLFLLLNFIGCKQENNKIETPKIQTKNSANVETSNNKNDNKIDTNKVIDSEKINNTIEEYKQTSAEQKELNKQLITAARNGNLEKIKELLSKTDVNIAAQDDPDYDDDYIYLTRPLLIAIKNNQTEAAKLLLENGADPNLADIDNCEEACGYVPEDKFNALGWALINNNNEIIDLILPKMKSKKEYLVAAACYGNNKIVKIILEEDTSTINKSGWIDDTVYTPLTCALNHYKEKYTPERKEVVKTLIAYGVDVNQPDPSGQDPMYYAPIELAVFTNDLETVKLLIDNGADINYINRIIEFYKTKAEITTRVPYWQAEISKGDLNNEIVKLLLTAGADKNGEENINIDIEREIKGTYSKITEQLKAAKAKEDKILSEQEKSKQTKFIHPRWWIEDEDRNLHPFSDLEDVIKREEKVWK